MNKAKKLIGGLIKFTVGAVVMVYLGLHTINFFMYTFPDNQWYLAWLGFGLTGGGLIGYLIVFLWDADSDLKRVISLIMMIICGVGEVMAAGFGMEIEAWTKAGFVLTEQDFNMMLLVVRILAFVHFLALILYIAGDKVGEMFGDHDKDGIPNYRDPDYKKNKQNKQPQQKQYPNWDLDPLLQKLNVTTDQAKALAGKQDVNQFYNALKPNGIEQIDISRRNFARLYDQLRANGHAVNPQVGERR